MNRIPGLLIRQILLLLLIFALGWVLFLTLHPFLPALLGAYTLYVLLRPAMNYLSGQRKWNRIVTAIILILVAFLVIGIPMHFLGNLIQARVISALQHSPEVRQSLENLVHRLEQEYGITLLTPDTLKNFANWGIVQLRSFISATLVGLMTTVLAGFIVFFMLVNSSQISVFFFNWLPFQKKNIATFKQQLNSLVYTNAIGIPFMGILQGMAGLPAYWLIGINDVWLWFVITCISGMLPILGVALAYVPMTIILVANGMPVKGLILFLYGFIVIGSVDNIGRMWLQKKLGDQHPLITLFGVIAGLKLFGFIGFVFGPILIALFFLLIRIYTIEFGRESHHIT
ncbi:MAG: AI-2E family transporter [Bacteroidetes bacterium]|nr:MAG: AI-2E family transporter [Bacteroidota bacterium]